MSDNSQPEQKRISNTVYALVAGLAIAVGFLAVYGTLGPNGNGTDSGADGRSGSHSANTDSGDKLNRGKMAGFVFRKDRPDLPDISFEDDAGGPRTLKDWRGKLVLLNLWATWCAPCREEMPALDKLHAELGGEKFEVLTLSLDRGGIKKPRKFYEDEGIRNLKLYVEPTNKQASKLKIIGMPTTILISPEGKEIGRLTGPAEWDSADAVKLLNAHMPN